MKILFIVPGLAVGGTTTVLHAIIKILEKHKHEAKVLYLYPNRKDSQFSDNQFSLKGHPMIVMMGSWRSTFSECGNLWGIASLFYAILRRVLRIDNKMAAIKKTASAISKEHFDIVIGMEEGIAAAVASKVTAKRKLAWIHCDYSRYLSLYSISDERDIYREFGQIVCVSKYTAKVFSDYYPDLASKTTYIHNPIDVEGILKKSKDKRSDDSTITLFSSYPTIVSIGRLDPVKRFHLVPSIASYLKSSGIYFKWYIVGDGDEKSRIQFEIVENGVRDDVILTGMVDNPYPLLSRAKLLVVLSESESCPNVLHEAKILHVPVISTDYPTAIEFIKNELDGIVVPLDKLPDAIVSTLQNEQLLSQLRNNGIDYNQYNETIEKKILGLLANAT